MRQPSHSNAPGSCDRSKDLGVDLGIDLGIDLAIQILAIGLATYRS